MLCNMCRSPSTVARYPECSKPINVTFNIHNPPPPPLSEPARRTGRVSGQRRPTLTRHTTSTKRSKVALTVPRDLMLDPCL